MQNDEDCSKDDIKLPVLLDIYVKANDECRFENLDYRTIWFLLPIITCQLKGCIDECVECIW